MARAAQRNRPAAEWAKIRAAYIAGEGSYRELAKRFGVAFGTLAARADREKWQTKRERTEHRTDERVIEKVASRRARLADLRWSVGEDLAKSVQESLKAVELYDPDGLATLARALNSALPADQVALDEGDGDAPLEGVEIIVRRKQPAGA